MLYHQIVESNCFRGRSNFDFFNDITKLDCCSIVRKTEDLEALDSPRFTEWLKLKNFLIFGTGGSSLCGQTICSALKKTDKNIRFVSNLDPFTLENVMSSSDFENTGFLFISKSGDSDVNRMRVLDPLVEIAFDFAKNKDHFKALNLNGLLYASTLGFDSSIAIDALQAGAIASGLSGTGSSFVAVCNENSVDDVNDAWSRLEGRVLQTNVDNDGCVFL